jgi:mannose-6-phosphate isomerase-like protein (cupin superfamily)
VTELKKFSEDEVRSMDAATRAGFDAEVRSRVVRFNETRAQWASFDEAQLPNHQRVTWSYFGGGGIQHSEPGVPAENFSFAMLQAAPGRGAPLHWHTTEEIFFVVSGRWCVYWGDEGQHRMFLDQWDSVSVPAPVLRGFWNAGTEPAMLLALQGGGQEPPAFYPDSVLQEVHAARNGR